MLFPEGCLWENGLLVCHVCVTVSRVCRQGLGYLIHSCCQNVIYDVLNFGQTFSSIDTNCRIVLDYFQHFAANLTN